MLKRPMTPGPWEVERGTGPYSGTYRIQGANGDSVIYSMKIEANANAIAAAPELLEALHEYMSQFGQALDAHGITYGPAQQAADRKARAAIAKAEGK